MTRVFDEFPLLVDTRLVLEVEQSTNIRYFVSIRNLLFRIQHLFADYW